MRKKPSSTSRSCVPKSTSARTMFSFADSWMPTMLSATRTTITVGAADDVPRVLLQRLPEDREVVRHEERRDGDRDDVVEHLRPRRPERDELVEGVAREARRAAGLGEADGALGVGGGGRGEEDAGDHEDERRQPEREDGGDAERVVDRGADVAVRGREERVRTEDALELLRSPSGHRRTVVRLLPGADSNCARRRAPTSSALAPWCAPSRRRTVVCRHRARPDAWTKEQLRSGPRQKAEPESSSRTGETGASPRAGPCSPARVAQFFGRASLPQELVRHRGEQHVRLEEEQPLHVEGALVVEQPHPAAGGRARGGRRARSRPPSAVSARRWASKGTPRSRYGASSTSSGSRGP